MIKQLSRCIQKYKKESILSPLMVTGEVVLDMVMPYLMAMIIDNGISKGDIVYILKSGSVLFVCALLALLLGVLSGKFAATASTGFAKNIRQAMYNNIQDFSFTNIDRFSPSSLVRRLTADVTNIQYSYQMIIRVLVKSPLTLLFSVIIAYNMHKNLSLIFIFAIPLLGFGLYYIQKNAQPIFKKVFHIYDRLNRIVQENLHGIRVVKSYVREDYENKKFTEVSEDIYRNYIKVEKLLVLSNPLVQLITYVCMLVLFWYGGNLIVAGALTSGKLVSLVTYVMLILVNLTMLSAVFVMLTMSRTSAERIVEVFDEEVNLHSPEKPINKVENGSITFKNVSFSYSSSHKQSCLNGVDLFIKSGQTVGIIGGTGSSKSTLVQLIPRLYDVIEGSIEVGGVDVREYDLKVLRNSIGIVLQKNILFSGTIKENLKWGNPNATDEEIVRSCEIAQANEFIEQFPLGYDTYIEQGGSNVSGGQKQRLCIARALLQNPKVLILDDSTSAVDSKTDYKLQKMLAKETPYITKIVIAQRISSIENADQIIILDDGKINAIGNHASLLASNKIYQEVYYSQHKGGVEHE